MSANQKRKTFCVWDNTDDSIVAIDLTADTCAVMMGITRSAFFSMKARQKTYPYKRRKWTIIASTEIESEEEQ